MGIAMILVLCSFVVGISPGEADSPFLSVQVFDNAGLMCCYIANQECKGPMWAKSEVFNKTIVSGPIFLKNSENMIQGEDVTHSTKSCNTLTFHKVRTNDTGLYQCIWNCTGVLHISDGTYLLVLKTLEKMINLSESTKNKILTSEAILLLLCVVLPSAILLCKTKKIHELEKKKMRKEEENIYQGLSLDDCCTTYDQIERSQGQGPYQDVCNFMEEEDIQLEKP